MRALLAILASAVMFLLAAFGWSSASASILCGVNENPCPAESTYEKGEPLSFGGTGGNASFVTNLGTFPCTANIGGPSTDVGGEGKAVKAEFTTFSFGCVNTQGAACFISSTKNLPYNSEFQGSGGNGTMTVPSLKVQLVCGLSISCTLASSGKVEFTVTGGKVAQVKAEGVPLVAVEGPNCPTTASLSATYGSPGFYPGLYVVGGPAPSPVVRLCKINADPCVGLFGGFTAKHPIGTVIEASLEGNSVFAFLYEGKLREPACEGGTLTGKTTGAGKPQIGEVSAMTFSSCGAGVCAVEAQALPYKAEFEKTTGGNGTMALVSGGSGAPKIEVNCGKSFKCIYKASSISFGVTGSATAPKLAVSQTLEKDTASEAECGASMTWKATYKLTKPTALFVTS